MQRVLVGVLMAACVGSATAQPPRGGGRGGGRAMSPAMLVTQASVQEDLKITAEQKQKLEDSAQKQRAARDEVGKLAGDERREKMRELNQESEKALAAIITPEQNKRLKQISLQVAGVAAFGSPQVQTDLNLTEEQKTEIKTVTDEPQGEMRKAREEAGDSAAPGDIMKKLEGPRKAALEKVVAMLTADQKAKWKEMTGEHFKGKIEMPQGGGGRKGPAKKPAI